MEFDPSKVLNVLTADKAKKGDKAFMTSSLLKLKECVEEEKLGQLFKLDGIGYKKGKYDDDSDRDIGDAVFRVNGEYGNSYYKFIYPINENDILPINFRIFEKDFDKIERTEKLKFKNIKEFRTVYYPKKEDEKVTCVFVIYYNMTSHPYLIKAPNEEIARVIVNHIKSPDSPESDAKYLYLGKTSLKGSTEKILEQMDPGIVEAYNLKEAKVVSAATFLKKHTGLFWLPDVESIEEPVYLREIQTRGIYGRQEPAIPHDYSLKAKWEKLVVAKGFSPDNCKLYEEEIDLLLEHPEWEDEILQTIFERYEVVEKYKDKWLKTVKRFYPEGSRIAKEEYDIYRAMIDYKNSKPSVEFERKEDGLLYATGREWKDVNTPWMPKSLIAYVAKSRYLKNEVEYYPYYYEGNSIGFIYKTPIPMEEARILPVAHANERECVCAKLNKNFIYATNRSEENAVTPPELSGLRLFHFVEDYKEHDNKFPFLTKHQVIALSNINNYYERCDDWKVYSAYEISVRRLTPLTKVPNTLKIGLWLNSVGYDPEYEYQTPTGRWICNYLKELNLHPIAGTYNEYAKRDGDYSKANCELIVGLNEEGKDYTVNYSKDFWDNVCFNDNEKIVIKSNKMNEYV